MAKKATVPAFDPVAVAAWLEQQGVATVLAWLEKCEDLTAIDAVQTACGRRRRELRRKDPASVGSMDTAKPGFVRPAGYEGPPA